MYHTAVKGPLAVRGKSVESVHFLLGHERLNSVSGSLPYIFPGIEMMKNIDKASKIKTIARNINYWYHFVPWLSIINQAGSS